MHVFVSMGSEDCFVFFSLWILGIALCVFSLWVLRMVFFSMGSEDCSLCVFFSMGSEDCFVCFCLYGF